MELVSRGAIWTQTGCGVDSYAAFFFKAGKCFVMRTCCCKYKFLEIFRLLRYADMRTMELSETFHQVMQLLRNTFKIVLL